MVWYPRDISRLHNLHPWYWNPFLYGLISPWGEFSAFSAGNANHNAPIFISPGTHHCWVGRGSIEFEVCPTLLHMISSGNWTPDLLILSQNTLTTERHAPIALLSHSLASHLCFVCAMQHCAKKPVTTMLTYPWKCTVLHCNHLGNTWKPLVLMIRHFDYCQSASEWWLLAFLCCAMLYWSK